MSTDNGLVVVSNVARACALKVAGGVVFGVTALALVGAVIEHWESISELVTTQWVNLLWLLSLGGIFWGAVFVGVAAMAFGAWGMCVLDNLPEGMKEKAKKGWIFYSVPFSGFLWFVANRAMQRTFVNTDTLNIYEHIAVYVMNAPYLILIMLVMLVAAMVLPIPGVNGE